MQKLLLAAAALGLGIAGASACDFHRSGHDVSAQNMSTGDTAPEQTVVASADEPVPAPQPAEASDASPSEAAE